MASRSVGPYLQRSNVSRYTCGRLHGQLLRHLLAVHEELHLSVCLCGTCGWAMSHCGLALDALRCALDVDLCSCTCHELACCLAFPSCLLLLLLLACRWDWGLLQVSPWCSVLLAGGGNQGAAVEGFGFAPGSPVMQWVLWHGIRLPLHSKGGEPAEGGTM